MANEVFANGLEVACKAADGVSSAAFPDVCFTPKEPVPFANTAYAKDMTNGSKTVFISGKMVGLKDHSYLKTSSGDNGARGRKGMTTGAKNGKAYFRSWSMNVKVEGYNVCRHTDSMSHNHGSDPGNIAPWYYTDTATTKNICDSDRKKAKKKCGKPQKNWKKHCLPKSEQDREKEIKNKRNKLNKKKKAIEKKIVDTIKKVDGLVEKVEKAAAKKAAKIAAKAGIKGWLGPLGWAWTAYDVIDGAIEIKGMYDNISNVKDTLKNFNNEMKNILKEIESFDKIAAAIANTKSNPCIRARACILHPHDKANEACCAGQQSHHLVPNAALQKKRNDKDTNRVECPDYDMKKAPCACGWDGSYAGGEHEAMHNGYKANANSAYKVNGNKLSLNAAIISGVNSHMMAHPISGCNYLCLMAQMNAYYKKACKGEGNVTVIPSDGQTKSIVENAKAVNDSKSNY